MSDNHHHLSDEQQRQQRQRHQQQQQQLYEYNAFTESPSTTPNSNLSIAAANWQPNYTFDPLPNQHMHQNFQYPSYQYRPPVNPPWSISPMQHNSSRTNTPTYNHSSMNQPSDYFESQSNYYYHEDTDSSLPSQNTTFLGSSAALNLSYSGYLSPSLAFAPSTRDLPVQQEYHQHQQHQQKTSFSSKKESKKEQQSTSTSTGSPDKTPLPSPIIPSTRKRRGSLISQAPKRQQKKGPLEPGQQTESSKQLVAPNSCGITEHSSSHSNNGPHVRRQKLIHLYRTVDQLEKELSFFWDECATILIMRDSLRDAFLADIPSSGLKPNSNISSTTINFAVQDLSKPSTSVIGRRTPMDDKPTVDKRRRSKTMAENPEMEREMRTAYEDLLQQVNQLKRKVEDLEKKIEHACLEMEVNKLNDHPTSDKDQQIVDEIEYDSGDKNPSDSSRKPKS